MEPAHDVLRRPRMIQLNEPVRKARLSEQVLAVHLQEESTGIFEELVRDNEHARQRCLLNSDFHALLPSNAGTRFPLTARYSSSAACHGRSKGRPIACSRAFSSTEYAGRRTAAPNSADVTGVTTASNPAERTMNAAISNHEQLAAFVTCTGPVTPRSMSVTIWAAKSGAYVGDRT